MKHSLQQVIDTSTWVVKKYLANALENIKEKIRPLSGAQRRWCKCTCLHEILPSSSSKRCASEIMKRCMASLSYNNIYLGKMEGGEVVTVEEFVKGSFDKYINNDGTLCATSTYILIKAESLSHYSYVTSYEKLMVVDIQGTSHKLFDPEISSY